MGCISSLDKVFHVLYPVERKIIVPSNLLTHHNLSLSVSPDSELDPELSQPASLGFTGCLSAVLFNSVSPLKAALLHPDTSPVSVTGPLVQSTCGSTSANPYAAEPTHHLSGQRNLLIFFADDVPAMGRHFKCFFFFLI